MILVPEATLTRAKYWMNEYPIVIENLQILDKQIYSKQQLEKSKLDANDFFTNNATILSIWFETCLQKEHWFHKSVFSYKIYATIVLVYLIGFHWFYVKEKKTSNELIIFSRIALVLPHHHFTVVKDKQERILNLFQIQSTKLLFVHPLLKHRSILTNYYRKQRYI